MRMSDLFIVWWWFAIAFQHFSCTYLKECVVILKFGSTVSYDLTKKTKLTEHKPVA